MRSRGRETRPRPPWRGRWPRKAKPLLAGLATLFLLLPWTSGAQQAATVPQVDPTPARPRIRDLGIEPGILPPGPLNALTDVEGVLVGQLTLIEGDSIRTGVTAILPHSGNLFQETVTAAVYVANAFGKAAGFLQVQELGTLETPIVLTNTLSVGTAVESVVAWTLEQPANERVGSVNAVVGETNDGYLNDIRGQHITASHVRAAIAGARSGAVEEGSVGAGTGTSALGWKGGIGTASRRLPESLGGYTLGALVQSNFGGVLTIDGVRVGEALGRYSFRDQLEAAIADPPGGPGRASDDGDDGSCMIVLATDAPLDSRQLERLARRAPLGLARAGSFISHGSGDFVIAFSTRNRVARDNRQPIRRAEVLREDLLSPLFLATVEAVEEAIYNSLVRATTVKGRDGHHSQAIPLDALRDVLGSGGP